MPVTATVNAASSSSASSVDPRTVPLRFCFTTATLLLLTSCVTPESLVAFFRLRFYRAEVGAHNKMGGGDLGFGLGFLFIVRVRHRYKKQILKAGRSKREALYE